MEFALSAIKRPLNEVKENNNPLLGRLYQDEGKKKYKQRERWTLSEDLKLKELVAVYGPRNWTHIGKQLQGRTSKTCRSRWFNHLDPRINKDAFGDEEEKMLLKAHEELGSKWSKIARLFHGRTDRAVNNHWHKLMTQKLKKQSTSPHETTANDTTEVYVMKVQRYNFISKTSQEETTYLKVSLAMFTPYVSISQPSSLSSSSLPSKAEDTNANIPPKFIDFLGVGDS